MLQSVRELHQYRVQAEDGDVGEVTAFTFDDESWTIRYLVVDAGRWLFGRRVLIPTRHLGDPKWEEEVFPSHLTKKQIEQSPDVDLNKPVSRRMEGELHEYYHLTPYWRPRVEAGTVAQIGAEGEEAESTVPSKRSALRSTREVFGYDVQAEDGDVGSVADFLVDDKSWNIRYLVVDTAQWLSRDKVLIAPDWVTEVDWALREVQVGLTREEVENAPSFDQSEPIERSYEVRLYDYYGRPKYWEQA